MPYIGRSSNFGVRTRFLYTATASQTTFSGTDTQNLTLSYSDSNFIDVHQNGVLLKVVDDYTATSGTSVVLATGATASDVIEITVYDVFSIANHIKKTGDAMAGALTNIDIDGTELILDADGDTSITADTDDQIDFKTGGSDRVIIDSSGNLLVGQTSQATNATGFSARANSLSHFCRDTSTTDAGVLLLNKKTGDGSILVIQKDDTTMGSIGSEGGNSLYILSGDTGLRFSDSSNKILPVTTAGSARDNAITLGSSGARFADFYIGGGIYLGGTGSANHLDDYEEGTFTPVLADATSGGNTASLGIEQGEYIKIGALVFFAIVAANIDTSGMTGGNTLIVRGLPFAGKTRGSFSQHFVVRTDNINVASSCFGLVGVMPSASSHFQFVENRDGAADNNFPVSGILSSTSDIFITGCYVSD